MGPQKAFQVCLKLHTVALILLESTNKILKLLEYDKDIFLAILYTDLLHQWADTMDLVSPSFPFFSVSVL